MNLLLRYTWGFVCVRKRQKDYLTEIEIRKYSPKTLRMYDTDLDFFFAFLQRSGRGDDVEYKTSPIDNALFAMQAVFAAPRGKEAGSARYRNLTLTPWSVIINRVE